MLGFIRRMFVQPWSATFLPGDELDVPTVTPLNALRYTPIYRAVTLISGDIARLPCEVTDSASDSLWNTPSSYMSAFEFRRSMTLQALLWGNAFAIINRTRGGELLELMPLDPDGVSLDLSGAQPVYKTRMYGDIAPENMLHLRAPGLSGLWGESPIRLCSTAVTTLAAQEQTALQNFKNGGNPRLALVHPGLTNEANRQKLAEEFRKRHAGSRNAGEPIVLGDGIKIERISSTLEDAGLEAARKYSIEDVARIYGVPPHMLGIAGAGNAYGSLEWWGRTYVDACLHTWLAAWRAEWLSKTAPFAQMTFDLDALLRPGVAEQMAALRTAVEAGFMTRNEARARIDLAPLDGLDEPIVAKNMGTGGGTTNIGTDTSAEGGTPNDF
jgi:HK97 family phage portal protein